MTAKDADIKNRDLRIAELQETCSQWERLVIDVRRAARREVMEWFQSHSQVEHCDPDVMPYFREYRWAYESEWQAKLKEWGVEELNT